MKKLMFFLASLPLISLANTNTVSRAEFNISRAEFDELKVEISKKLHELLELELLEIKLKSALSDLMKRTEAWEKQRDGITARELRKARMLHMMLCEEKEKLQDSNAATTSTTNAPTLFRK